MLNVPGIKYFTNKNSWCGNHNDFRCRIAIDGDKLQAFVWPEPYCFDKTDKENIKQNDFSKDEQGLADAIKWVEDQIFI